MNALQNFNFNDQSVRIVIVDNEPWWNASDVCSVLGYKNGRDAISKHCREGGVAKRDTMLTDGRMMPMSYINEGNLYRLITKSELPAAEPFERWVFDVVLPQIRKTGSYSIQVPKTLPEALRAYAAEIEEKERALVRAHVAETALIELTPKAEKYNQFLDAKNLATLEIAAKSLGIGRNKLTTFLRDKKIFYRKYDNGENHVYQKYLDSGYFIVKIQSLQRGEIKTNYPQIFVTAKGLSFIQDMFRKGENAISTS